MKVVVVGKGAREHALAHVLSRTAEVLVTPGNGGTQPSTSTPPEELDADLFVIGPEDPLVAGMADSLRAQGKLVFGPGADGARFEGSKTWMKSFFDSHDIPTARYGSFSSVEPAVEFLKSLPGPWVVKADGLAAGKGVLVASSLTEAEEDVRAKLSGAAFGDAGRTVVIEEHLSGPELSVMAVCDGKRAVVLAPARDYKRIRDRDEGPNTGGMGAYSPVPDATEALIADIELHVLLPTLEGLREMGIDYRGALYAGLVLTPAGPKMLEYNVRFGDPEAQVVLPRLDGDLASLLAEAAAGDLSAEPKFGSDACVTVMAACEGYPESPRTGDPITGPEDAESIDGVTVFHAGTALEDGQLVTSGGRVLCVSAVAATLDRARDKAYEGIARVRFAGMQYRSDIAQGVG